jgi:hypothetical protein
MDIMDPYKLAREITLNGSYETSTVHHQGWSPRSQTAGYHLRRGQVEDRPRAELLTQELELVRNIQTSLLFFSKEG